LKRRLDHALRLMLAESKDERPLMEIAKCCGFGGISQFSRAFRTRFGVPPRQYLALLRRQDVGWLEARMMVDGFEHDAFVGGNRG
jgi:AraC-like DNA-binding protein